MNHFSWSALLLVPILLGGHGSVAAKQPAVPPNEEVAGISQAKWSQKWWQWAGSFEREESPVADQNGALCGRRQSGPVWFLAGTYGTKRTVRACEVPRGKYLFFPLVNNVVGPPGDRPATCRDVIESAAAMSDHASYLVAEIDGVRLKNLKSYRQAPQECFDIGARTEPRLRVYPCAANGYYVMLKPLSPGRHELNFGGIMGGMAQAVTYTLEVK